LDFKDVQNHQCKYPRKACQQCLLWYATSQKKLRIQGCYI